MDASGYRKLVFGCAIAGLSLWYGISQLVPGAGPAPAEATTGESVAIEEVLAGWSVPAPATSEAWLREQATLAATDWPEDPFFGAVSAHLAESREDAEEAGEPSRGTEQPRFVLNAIISGAEPLAMIDGLIVAVGYQLADGSVITAIDTYSVTLQRPQGPWILRLSE
jgi:hypothetical protein